MGWLSSVVEGVTKVADYATGGKIGDMISNALEKMGLPKEICNVFAMIGDPSYSTKAICEEIDRVGKALGLPEELTGSLKKLVHKAEQYTQAFFQGGFGAVVCAVGKDLGLPPALYEGIAALVDTYTGNAAGAAAHLAKFALECARFLGVPESSLHMLKLAADVVNRDTKAIIGDGLQLAADVADQFDIAPEFKDLIHAGANAYASTLPGGDNKAMVGDLARLAGHLGERVGLPPEFSSGLKLGAAWLADDENGMKAAGKELCHELIQHLDASAEVKMLLDVAANQAVDHGGEIKDGLAKMPELIKNGTPKVKAQVEAITSFIEGLARDKAEKADEASSDIDWKTLAGKLLDSVKSGTVKILESTKQEAIKALEDRKATAAPEERIAIQLAIDLLEGDKDGLQADLNTIGSALKNDPDGRRLVMLILGGNAEAAKNLVEPQKDKDGNRGESAEIRQADRLVHHFIRA